MASKMFILIGLSLFGTIDSLLIQESSFSKVTTINAQMLTLNISFECTNLICCAISCNQLPGSCFSFIYDSLTSECILGSWIVPFTSTVQDMYTVGAYCKVGKNFKVVSNGVNSFCVYISNVNAPYSAASGTCKSLLMKMFTLKTLEKLGVLKDIIQETNYIDFWVGINDRTTEDTFVWDDDNTAIDAASRQKIFAPGRPDANGDEDCVAYDHVLEGLDDRSCLNQIRYVCERSFPQKGF